MRSLPELQLFALEVYSTSPRKRLDAKYGKCPATRQMLGDSLDFAKYLGQLESSFKLSVLSEMTELKGEVSSATKKKVLGLLTKRFESQAMMKNLIVNDLCH